MRSITELNEYCQVRNFSIIVHNGYTVGFRTFDYPVEIQNGC